MKKIILFLAIATSSYCSNAQVYDTGTKVGIGAPNPHSLLHVSSTVNQPYNSDFGIVSITPSSDVNMSLSLGYDASLGTNGSGWIQSIRSATAYTPLLLNPINANVGIGTTSPQSKLHIYQAASDATGLVIQGNTINTDAAQHYIAMTLDGDYGNGGGNYSQIRSYSNLYYSWGSQLAFYTTQAGIANTLSERMRIDWNGNVGIGTASPGAKLHVQADANTSGAPDNAQFYITGKTASGKRLSLAYNTSSNYGEIQSQAYAGGYTALNLNPNGGNVLIGKTSEQPGANYKLDIGGSARADKIVVNTSGADFVFDKKYLLPKLSDVKAYIDEHQHLPEIPSAKEMQANGMSVGEINTKLLQKVEELTLYAIEQQKRIDQLEHQQTKSEQQDARIAVLEKALSKLTNNQSK